MTPISFVAIPLILASCAACGQTPEKPLSFEVASVKPASAPISTKDDYTAGYNAGMRMALAGMGMRISGQRVTVTDNSLRDLIRLAYQVKDYQISGPAWMAEEKYEIAATMPAGSTRSQAPDMLRTLLEQRFHLKLHRETRQMTAFALVAGKTGARLTAASASRGGPGVVDANGGRVRAIASTLEAFADLLTKAADLPVLDETGIAGKFDFDLTYRPALSTAPDAGPGLERAVEEQLGLRLEKRKMPIEVLMVESGDKVPTEN